MTRHSWRDPHMVRSSRSLLKALYMTAGTLLLLFVFFHIAGALYVSHLGSTSVGALRSGIAHDLSRLQQDVTEIAQREAVQRALLAKDSSTLLSLLQKEKTSRSIGSLGVADSNGLILGRTTKLGVRGDNVFLTFPEGRAVAQGETVQTVSQSIINPSQTRITVGMPIVQDGRMIGGLFASQLLDDAYAARFKDAYLPAGAEVAFYNKEFGVFGASFSGPQTRSLVHSYFNSGSEWIRDGMSDKIVSFKDGNFYLVENVVFPGLESSTAGALVFIPRIDATDVANLATAFVTLLIFIVLATRYHVRSRGQERGWRYYVLLAGVSVPVLMLSFLALGLQSIGHLSLERIPYILYNSTLRLQPDFGIYDKGFEQTFSVMVDTGDEPINAVQLALTVDPKQVEVKSIEASSSTCAYVVERSVDPAAGTARLSCVALKSEGNRGSFQVADVTVLPLRTGTFEISFDKEETKVLANDGLGTDVLRMAQPSSYHVDDFDLSGMSANPASSTKRSFIVFSPTHPNQSRWYNSPTIRFVWLGEKSEVYKYAFDNVPDTKPSNANALRGNSIDIPAPGDGIYYFHLQLAAGGPIAHYRVQIDSTPPEILSMRLSKDQIVAGDVVRFSFEAHDAGSGIQQNYYVDLGNHLFLPVGPELFIPFLEPGDQKITLRVYDVAGNYSEASQVIHVANP